MNFEVNFPFGTLYGEQSTETVNIAGLHVCRASFFLRIKRRYYARQAVDQTFGAITEMDNILQSAALMGMAFDKLSVFKKPSVFQTLINKGIIDFPVFAFKLASSRSELFLGGTNKDSYVGDFTGVSLTVEVCHVTLRCISSECEC